MCKEHTQAICGPEGSYCEDDTTEGAQKYKDLLPTAISKYPHTVSVHIVALLTNHNYYKQTFNLASSYRNDKHIVTGTSNKIVTQG